MHSTFSILHLTDIYLFVPGTCLDLEAMIFMIELSEAYIFMHTIIDTLCEVSETNHSGKSSLMICFIVLDKRPGTHCFHLLFIHATFMHMLELLN